jgi:uncharacterized delta-60 repeat protein
MQPDGKTVICGFFSTPGNPGWGGIARLNVDGSLDGSFSATTSNPDTNCVAVQPDGKILVAGRFGAVNGTDRIFLARLNSNGSLESTATFNSAIKPLDSVVSGIYCMALQPDGKILIGGYFGTLNGAGPLNFARLNPDGNLENTATFNVGAGANGHIYSIALQTDGRILLGGNFGTVNGAQRSSIARLHPDGSVESLATFNPGTGPFGEIDCIAVQPDGKILLGGTFTEMNGAPRKNIARLNADGSVESTATFNPGTGANDRVISILVQADGKILLGGAFTAVNGVNRHGVARLNPDGSVESTDSFNPGAGVDFVVIGLTEQLDSKIVVNGRFTTYNGEPRRGMARLSNDPVVQSLVAPDPTQIRWLRGGSAQEVSHVTFDVSTNGGSSWTPLGAATRIAGGWQLTGQSLPGTGSLRARGRTAGGGGNASNGFLEQVATFTFNPPIVTTGTATAITAAGATLNGSVNPNGGPTNASFQWGLDTSYGQTTSSQPLGNGAASVPIATPITGLLPHKNYHFRAVATNPGGTVNGADAMFATSDTTPVANGDTVELPMSHFNVKANDTDADGDALTVTNVGIAAHGTAVLNADQTVNYTPNATFTGTDSFTYTIGDGFGGSNQGTVTVTDTTIPVLDTVPPAQTLVTAVGPGAMPDLSTLTTFHDNSGLADFSQTPAPGTPLPFGDTNATIKVTDHAGLSVTASVTIHVVAPPTAITGLASGITLTSVTLNATVNPNKMATTAYFEYGPSEGYGLATPVQNLGGGIVALPLTADLSGLPVHTAYHFRIVAANGTGTSFGADAMFITGDSIPLPGPDVMLIVTQPHTIDPLANDTDPEGDSLAVTGVTNGTKGTSSFTPATVTYTPVNLGNGTDLFSYTVGDGFGGLAQGTVKVYSVGSQAGFYAGLLENANEVNGQAQITLGTTGKLTGRIDLRGVKYPFKGQLDENGGAAIQISRNDQARITLHLQLLPGVSPVFEVAITDLHDAVLGKGDAVRSGTGTPGKQRYTMVLPPDPAHGGQAAYPQGTGYAILTLSKAGKISIAGKLGDGAAFSTASSLRSDDTFPLYAGLYGKPRGQIYGIIARREVPGVSDLDGTLTWLKKQQVHPNPPQANGFTTTTAVFGSLYVTPKPIELNHLLIYNATGDASATFTEGGLAAPVTGIAHVGVLNPIMTAPPLLGLNCTVTNGLFTGTFVAPGSITRKFRGVALQKQNLGLGYFLTPSQSGTFNFIPTAIPPP